MESKKIVIFISRRIKNKQKLNN